MKNYDFTVTHPLIVGISSNVSNKQGPTW